MTRRLLNDTQFAQWLETHSAHPVTPDVIRAWFDDLASPHADSTALEPETCRRVLRQLRERVFYCLLIRDIAGDADLSEVTKAMTALADLAVSQAYRTTMHQLVERHGTPLNPDTLKPQEMMIVAMGKLGGCELNVSSDIDLIMLYDKDGETAGPRTISNHEFYSKLTRLMMSVLSEQDGHGFVFRTDLRLRPDGNVSALAWSLNAFEQYLKTQGREWERYAWLKARTINARAFQDSQITPALHRLESLRRPFVYRKYFDFDALAALRDLRQRIREDWTRKASVRAGVDAQHNIKLGDGGIREIEFVVQLTQLIRGGNTPALQQSGLLIALHAQVRAGVIPKRLAIRLEQAYRFLRRLEHMLQYREDEQTHLLPSDTATRDQLARAMGLTLEVFEQTLAKHRQRVETAFHNAFRLAGLPAQQEQDSDDETPPEHLSDGADPDKRRLAPTVDLATPALIEQFGQDSTVIETALTSFLDSHRIRKLRRFSKDRIEDLVPEILRASLDTPNARATCIHLFNLVETVAQRSAYLALLVEYPMTLTRVAMLMGASPWAAQYVIRHPIVLNRLIDWETLMQPLNFAHISQNLVADLAACILPDGKPDVESQMNLMRDLQHQITFQLLAQDLAGVLTVESLADSLSALADLLLAQTLECTWSLVLERAQEPVRDAQFAIIAYGKLGSKELGYASDLDLVFLYDDTSDNAPVLYARLVSRLTSWLSTLTSSGRLYAVDLRLRPEGDAGLLVSSLSAFENYQLQHAWVWEHQALTRARFVAGDARLGKRFEDIRQKILTLPRDAMELASKVLEMRHKISTGHPNPTTKFDIKHDDGAMVDLEFVTQYLVLLHAHTHPELVHNLGNIGLLRICASLGLVDEQIAQNAIDAYRTLRKRQHALRLQGEDKARVEPEELESSRKAVRALWKQVLGER